MGKDRKTFCPPHIPRPPGLLQHKPPWNVWLIAFSFKGVGQHIDPSSRGLGSVRGFRALVDGAVLQAWGRGVACSASSWAPLAGLCFANPTFSGFVTSTPGGPDAENRRAIYPACAAQPSFPLWAEEETGPWATARACLDRPAAVFPPRRFYFLAVFLMAASRSSWWGPP